MGFEQALSGLNAASQGLDAIGNNIANSGTVGFKMQTPQFADIFASALGGGSASQIGIGVSVSGIQQQFSQGNVTTSNNPLDLALNGSGMFRLNDHGTITYTRDGQFQLDSSGHLVNAAGQQLTGLAADSTTGAIIPGSYVPLQVNNSAIAPVATKSSVVQANLDARATPPTSMTAGTATATAAPTSLTIAAGVNDTISGSVDGVAFAGVVIPAATYSSTATLATAIQKAINSTASPAGLGTTTASVTVGTTVVGGNTVIQMTSNSVGSVGSAGKGSTVSVLAGNGAANLSLGAATVVAGVDNFSLINPSSYTSSTAETVYDSLGNAHNLQLYYAKTSDQGAWQLYTSLDGGAVNGPSVLSFNSTGSLTTTMPLTQSFTVATGAATPLSISLDLTGSTQYGISFGTNQMTQNGFTSGMLTGMSVSSDGTVQGTYSNGESQKMGQIVLANFNNLNGLQSIGGNQWAQTTSSGQAILGQPGTGNLGLVQSGAIEASNVDMTAELVALITQQRNYQANSQTIKTENTLMQTLVNLQ